MFKLPWLEQKSLSFTEVTISWQTIFRFILAGLLLWFFYFIRDILGIFIIGLFLAVLFNPWVNFLEKKNIPRPVGIVMIYIVILGILILLFSLFIPILIDQIKELITNFSTIWAKITSFFSLRNEIENFDISRSIETNLVNLEKIFSSALSNTFLFLASLFGGILSFIFVLVITFYILIDKKNYYRLIFYLIPAKHQKVFQKIFDEGQEKIFAWLKGEILLCLAVGLAGYIGLLLLKIKYAFLLGVILGLTEIIPYAGPFLGGAIAVIFALADSPFKAFLVVVLVVLIQQLENNILVPKIMKKTVGVNPLVTIFALLIGFRLGGVVGALLAIPTAAFLFIIINNFLAEIKTDSHPELSE